MTDIFKSSVLPDASESGIKNQESTIKRDALSIVIQDAQDMQSSTTITSLSGYINKCWTSAREAKKPIQEALNASALQRRGEYSAEKLSEIKQMSGSTVFMDITSVKCRAAEAWIGDMLSPFNDLIWSISPTPIPTLPPDIKQYIDGVIEQDIQKKPMLFKTMDDEREYREYFYDESLQATKKDAQLRSTRMQNKILDQLTEAGWKHAIGESISDIVTYKAGFLKGPFVRRKPATDWVQDMSTGAYKTDVIDKLVVEYERPSPFNIYPSPDSTNIEDGFLIEHHRLSRKDLVELEGVPGYDEDAIHLVLEKFGETGTDSWLWEKREQDEAEGRTQSTVTSNPETIIDALEFWGSCSGKLLLDWGMEESDIEDPDGEYQINAWLIGEYIIKAVLNPHPLKRKPYYKASFEEINGSFWGRGVPELMASIQEVCNATARALVNNEGICCLTGDTIVYRDSGQGRGKYDEITIQELFDKKNDFNSGLRRIKLRSLDEKSGELFRNRIVDVFDNGIQPVYEVLTENGYRIKATMNHRFLNSAGEWIELSEFDEGDEIAVNGRGDPIPRTHECIDCSIMIVAKAIRCKPCHLKWHNDNQMRKAAENRDANENTARGRKACKDARKDVCEICGSTHVLEVHHKDRSPYNNNPDNLICLCTSCHNFEHKRYDNLGDPYKHKYVDYDKIVRIRYMGSERVYDLQMEAPYHNFVANGFISHNSGPQIAVDTSKLEPGQNIEEMYPWKVWYYDSALASWSSTGGEAIKFFNPQSNASELLAVYNQFSLKADEYTGIPAYTYGSSDVGGAGRTASGLSMLMSNASKAIKFVLASIDSNIIEPSITSLYLFNMMYDEDNSIKGDLVVRARGALSLVQKEQMTVRRTEFMNMLANNPMYLDIIGKKGVSILLRDVIKSLEMPWEDIVPSEQEIEANDAEKQFMNQVMQMAMAVQQGQMAPEEFIQQIMSQLPQQQGGQGGQGGQGMLQGGPPLTGKGTPVTQANTSPISPVVNRGTPPRARGTMPDGSIAGGRDASLFLQRRQ